MTELLEQARFPATHVFTVHTEEDKEYLGEAPGAESLDRWVSWDLCAWEWVPGEALWIIRSPCLEWEGPRQVR